MNLPKVLKDNGEVNQEWVLHYMSVLGCEEKQARNAQQRAILEIATPDLQLKNGKLNPVWITWYRACKRISTNVAIRIGKERIVALQENTGKVKDVIPHFKETFPESSSYESEQRL